MLEGLHQAIILPQGKRKICNTQKMDRQETLVSSEIVEVGQKKPAGADGILIEIMVDLDHF